MKGRDKKKEQSSSSVDDHSTEQKRKDEFKIELIKVGKLVQNTEQIEYDGMTTPPPEAPA